MKRKLELLAASLIVIITAAVITASVHAYRQDRAIHFLEQTKTQRESDLQKTEDQLKNSQGQKDQLEQKAKDQEKQIQDLNSQLQARKAERESIAAAAARSLTATATVHATPAGPAVVAGCGDNSYAQFIYQHESGCNLNAVNAGGCRGIGQACPGSKLPCGADYACQNAFFTQYANDRYGGWAGAYSAWINQGWW